MATGYSQSNQIKSRPEFADIIKPQDQFATSDDTSGLNGINSWFDQLMVQSGLPMAPIAALMLCGLFAITVGGLIFVLLEDPLATAIGLLLGFAIPIAILLAMRSRRQSMILRQMPPMIDELARAARTGRSLDQCLEMVAEDTPAPLGDEMDHCVRKLQMGVTMNEALYELPERTGVNGLRILATALSVHQQTGGDLVRVLERLSKTLRDRSLFLGRLRAITAGSRATAILMIILPPAILAFFIFRDPNYLSRLMNSDWGFFITVTGIVLEIVGAIWIWRILGNTQNT
ncbi:type II secretion system F family protein [Rubinisphaera sp.]|uniref:type II secretion system F family protein n=1 Tax=Rubinisphaera sp. TaxID=2024857 RepID=UPI000C11E890|nr:type II secretion system F family protein [Rubinisphaera sp.]MBV10419.1 pilus assembly protein TadB [Rubinisphaera sp.]HCS53301.1 pilus assembly protein TadB [Planctomycetaceae bacterium]|tara:strand:+ start:6608 stop:7471 length:864 start_codon:yes stop_codon:yes gene_type:complete